MAKNNKAQNKEEGMSAQILEIGKPMPLIIGKTYACEDDGVRTKTSFWVEASKMDLLRE